VDAGVEKGLGDVRVAVRRRQAERVRLVVLARPLFPVGARLDEQADNVEMASVHRQVQWRTPGTVRVVHRRALRQ